MADYDDDVCTELPVFGKLEDTDPFYRGQLQAGSHVVPRTRHTEISRPTVHVHLQSRVVDSPGNLYKNFGFRRSTRRS